MKEPTTATARQLQSRALNAEGTRDRAREALYRPDGSKRYSDEEHNERQRAISEMFREALTTIEEDVEREAATAETELATLEHGDPTTFLNTEELERAGAKRVFVNEDVEGLPAREIAGRLRAVLGGGDKASIFCYLQATERRVRETNTPPDGVSEVLTEMRSELMGDSRRREIEGTRLRMEEAREVKGLVWNLRRGGRNAGEVYRKQAYGDIAQRFGSSAGGAGR